MTFKYDKNKKSWQLVPMVQWLGMLLFRLAVCGSSAHCDKFLFSFFIPFGVIFFLSYNGSLTAFWSILISLLISSGMVTVSCFCSKTAARSVRGVVMQL